MAINDPDIKKDTRRDAWDRDYLPYGYKKPIQKETTRIENAKPVFIFAFFYVAILVMMGNN